MINKLELYGISDQPEQRDAYLAESNDVEKYEKMLLKKLKKKDRKYVIRLMDAQNDISYFTAKDCYLNGFCVAMKFIIDNIYEEQC